MAGILKKDKKLFRFRSFTEQIANIKIDVIHHVASTGGTTDTPAEEQSFFHESLLKWREINCSAPFMEFYFDVIERTQTLPLLVHYKDTVIVKLKEHLQSRDSLEQESLLDLLVQLARDLQADFYPYFVEFFPILVSLCHSQDAKSIENVFTCLAYLFKFLWRHMLRDISSVFQMYSELLLSSQRDYMRQFAVESFGFLLRKVRNVEGLCELILRAVAVNSELANGVGQLMFEVCRGVQKQFHSCIDKFLPVLYSKAVSVQCSENQHLLQAMCKMTELMAEYTRDKYTTPLWNNLLTAVEQALQVWSCEQSDISSIHLTNLIHLFGILTSWREGNRITTAISHRLCTIVLTLVKDSALPFDTRLPSVTLHLLASLLLVTCGCGQVLQEIVSHVFSNWSCIDHVTDFVWELLTSQLSDFDTVILPRCLIFCERISRDESHWKTIVIFLTGLCLHPNMSSLLLLVGNSSSSSSSEESSLLSMYTVLLEREMNKLNTEDEQLDQSLVWCILKCVQSIRPVSSSVLDAVSSIYHWYMERVSVITSSENDLLCFVSQLVQTLLDIDDKFVNNNTIESVISLAVSYPTNLSILQAVLSYCTAVTANNRADVILTGEQFVLLLHSLQDNLSSPSESVRSVTLQILKCYPELRPVSYSQYSTNEEQNMSLIDSCLQAERVPVSLETYRNKLIWLSKLKYISHRYNSLHTEYREIPLRCLLGVLYTNFSLLWEPVLELISSYACGELKEMFWRIFGSCLQTASSLAAVYTVTNGSVNKLTQAVLDPVTSTSDITTDSIFLSFIQETKALETGHPDYYNYRQLLWRCTERFPEFSRSQSRLLVPLMCDFIGQEYGLNDESNIQDISSSKRDYPEDECVQEGEEEEESMLKSNRRRGSSTKGHTGLNKTLSVMLSLMSKFSNPRAMYHQEVLQSFYMKLLMSSDPQIQKLSLSCLMAYRLSHLVSYRENLEQLLDEKTFREQLLLLDSSSDTCIVAKEHAEGLIPILIRILYGRMRRSAKNSTVSRKSSVLRFIASCGEREIGEFVSIISTPFLSFEESLESVTPYSVIPLKRQLGFLHELKQLLSAVADQLGPHLPVLLPLMFSIARSCNVLLTTEMREQVASQFINTLKNIRQLVIGLTTEIFSIFSQFDLTPYQESLLSFLVWPQLIHLPQECLQCPTPLLKLILVWSQYQELYFLFTAPVPVEYQLQLSLSSSQSPILHYVYQCLANDTVSVQVSQSIMELTLNLLRPHVGEDEESGDECNKSTEPFSVGLSLVQPFIPVLLAHLSSVIKCGSKETGKLRLEFNLLSRICSHVSETAEAELLIELLLPLLSNQRDTDHILTSIFNLISSCDITSGKFFRPLSKLFSTLTKRSSRDILCKIFHELAVKDESLVSVAQIVSKLNSWCPDQIEEPNYEVRQEGFSEARQLVVSVNLSSSNKEGPIEAHLILPVLHNALYFVRESDELSLRDGAASLVSSIIQTVTIEYTQAFETLILGTVLPSVKNGLRAKKETTVSEFVDILSQLVTVYPSHFSDLVQLSHHDPEADFFKNVCHIQLHRRTRAFHRLVTVVSQSDLSQNTMMSYLLPLASHIVFAPLSSRESNLLQEAVNVIGAIAAKLKWTNYYNLLRHYLSQLSHHQEIHRHISRAVVSILDHFHFHVSKDKTDSLTQMETDHTAAAAIEEQSIEENKDHLPEQIHKAIVSHILPSLESCLTLQSEIPQHRLSQKENNFDAEKLRVPVAMAMTKLLLCLPKSSMESQLSSLLLKVCQTLRSRAQDVRSLARTTLLKMSQALGGEYLHWTLKELRESLTRGYQLHVLSYTVHHLLHGLTSVVKVGDLDSSLDHFNEILIPDLFGHPAEERQIDKLIGKIPEGKRCKSAHTYGLIARFLSPSLLPSLLQPVQEALETQPTSKVVIIVEDVLKKVVYGILSNKGFTSQTLLLFVHGTVNKTIPQLKPKLKPAAVLEENELYPLDCRLLPPKPSRSKPRPVYEADISANVISQFGLQLLFVYLRKEKQQKLLSKEILEMIDPFVMLLTEALVSRHVKLLTRALQCLMIVLKLPLPSVKEYVPEIVVQLFSILKHYVYIGTVSTDSNQELVAIAFKSMTVILQDFTSYSLSEEELKVLLSYIEQDVHDYRRQSTAFPLLKVILTRKLLVPEMHEVMFKIAELVVNGDSSKIRANSRHAVVQFMMNYSLGKKINQYLDFFIANISYEEQHGRESVLEVLNLIFNKFSTKFLQSHATYFFIPLVSQMINDNSPLCRKMISQVLKTLLTQVGKEARKAITAMILDWFSQEKVIHKQLAVQSLGILVDVEGSEFREHLPSLLPLLATALNQDSTSTDHYLFTVLTVLEKIFTHCGVDQPFDSCLFETACNIWESIYSHLLHTHTWVRYTSTKLFGLLFSSCNISDLVSIILTERKGKSSHSVCLQFFVNGDGFKRVEGLQDSFMKQLKAPLINSELANQTVKNIVFIGRILFSLISEGQSKQCKKRKLNDQSACIAECDNGLEMQSFEQLEKLVHRMDKLARYESGHHPKEALKRTCVFKWIAAISSVIGADYLQRGWLVKLLPPLYKELNDSKKSAGEELHNLASEVMEHIKQICGKAQFSCAYSKVHDSAQAVRLKRKAEHALNIVQV